MVLICLDIKIIQCYFRTKVISLYVSILLSKSSICVYLDHAFLLFFCSLFLMSKWLISIKPFKKSLAKRAIFQRSESKIKLIKSLVELDISKKIKSHLECCALLRPMLKIRLNWNRCREELLRESTIYPMAKNLNFLTV